MRRAISRETRFAARADADRDERDEEDRSGGCSEARHRAHRADPERGHTGSEAPHHARQSEYENRHQERAESRDRGALAIVDETFYFTSVMALQSLTAGDIPGLVAALDTHLRANTASESPGV